MSILADRRFFVHAPHNAVGLSPGMVTWQPGTAPAAPLPAKRAARRLCLVSACPSRQSDESLASLASFLEQHYEVACTKAFARTRGDLPGLEELSACQCTVLFAQRLAIAGQQLEQVREYFAAGGSVVALIGPAAALENWPEWEAEILGIQRAGRIPGSSGALVAPAPFAEGHPILRSVEGLTHGASMTAWREVGGRPTALLTAGAPFRCEPVAWVRNQGGRRAFFTTLGDPADFQKPAMLQLLANAVLWASGDEETGGGQ
ncbi:MAG: ThuA domain-containing protein [Pirellulales bacterium]|nr:ThuA domain-containing protein [Thermoguttaceae bacterium]MDD4786557.1 ThuA domain-containing protein [Pirellulales bacterium]